METRIFFIVLFFLTFFETYTTLAQPFVQYPEKSAGVRMADVAFWSNTIQKPENKMNAGLGDDNPVVYASQSGTTESPRMWKKLTGIESFPGGALNNSTYMFDRGRRMIYFINISGSVLHRYSIDNHTFESFAMTNVPGIGGAGGSLYNPERDVIQFWRTGPDNVYEVSVTGGAVVKVGNGSSSHAYYGANSIYSGVTHNPVVMFGYGLFRYRNSFFELVNGSWVLRRGDNTEQPYRRGTIMYPSGDYKKAYIIDGTGNQSGDQFESSCSLPGGAPWSSDSGYWCWFRDIWEIDLATMTAREVLPVNSNFGVTGSFGYDYEHNKFYSFGGFRPPSAKGPPIVWEDSLRVFDPSEGVGWKVVSQGGDKRPVNHSTSFYDAEEDRFLVLSADGIYELRIGSDDVPEEEAGCKVVIKSSVEGMSAELCADSTGVVFLDAILGERDTIYSRYIDSRPDSQFVYVCLDHPMGIDQSALYDLELRDSGGGVSRDTQLFMHHEGDLAVALGVYTNDGGATFSRTYTAGSQKCWELAFFFDGSGANGYMGSEGGAGSNYFVLEAKEVVPDVPEEPNPEVEELRIWKKLVSKEDFPAAVINYSPYTFDRERRVVYILQADQFKLFRYNIDSNTFDSVEITNYPAEATNGGSIIYNPSRNTIQLWRPGPDKVFEVSVDGGPVLQIGTGSFSSQHYGSNPIYNGATNNPLFLFGYGGFRYKNSAFELVNGNWVLRRNDNGDQPYRRGTQVYPNADYTKALIIDGTGNQSGNQFESSCSLPGGAPWASDVGYWCWMRDIWEIDLATMSAREVLPVNSNFGVTGSFGYDYEHNKFYSFGGFRPPSVKWGPIVWEDSLRVFDPSEGVGWKVVSQGGDKRPVNHSTSFYDAEEDRFLVLSADGIYELRIGSDEVPEEEAGCKVVIKSSVEGMSAELCADSTGVVFLDAILGERDTIYSRYTDSRPDSQFVYVCLDHPMGIDQSALYDLELRDSNGGVSRDTQLFMHHEGDLAVALGV